jgi:fructose-1,6-bisphosphatase II
MKHVHLDLVKVTEAAAIEASHHVGRGDKIAADKAATEAMKDRLNRMINFSARIAIGEGKKDDAPGLFKGDLIGEGEIQYDIAVDPLDGTTQTSKGGNEAMSVIAVGNKGCLLDTEDWYMNKLAYGPDVAKLNKIKITDPIKVQLQDLSTALRKDIKRITVCVLDRPRHSKLIQDLRESGCRIKLIQDCDITAAIATAIPDSGIDAYMGIGGSPEGVIGAAAIKCLKGGFQGVLCNKDGIIENEKILYTEDLAKGDVIFCATGVTDGSLLKGVRWTPNGPATHSITMRSESGTVRWISTIHGN